MCVEEDEYDRNGFEDENDHDSAVGDRRYGGRHSSARNQEDNKLRNIKMKIIVLRGWCVLPVARVVGCFLFLVY